MKILVVDDSFANLCLLQKILSKYGKCEIAANGNEAISMFESAQKEGQPFELVCLDIILPDINGQQILQYIRSFEEDNGIYGPDMTKIIMITADDTFTSLSKAFNEQCDAYIVKPATNEKVLKELLNLGLVESLLGS